jgi:hypothetical protein
MDGVDGTPTVANPYHYVNNDPLNLQDPLGLRPPLDCDFGLEAVGNSGLPGDVQDSIAGEVTDHGGCIIEFFNQNGDCCLSVAYGDIDRAQNIGIVLEGTGQSLGGFAGGVGEKARAVLNETDSVGGGSTAVVGWLGYDSPESPATGYQTGPANEGGEALANFVAWLRARRGNSVRITAIGHSYGSIVVGEAMSRGMRADAAVVTGSPGINAGSVAETGFSGDFYVGCADADRMVHWAGFVGGPDPCAESGPIPGGFSGARYLDVSGSSGHNEYFKGTSLRSIAAVVTGSVRERNDGSWGAP